MLCVEPGEKLKLARRYHAPALSQADLAKILKVDTSTVGRWESKDYIPPDQLPRVAAILNVKEEWFTDGSNTPPSGARRTRSLEPSNVEKISRNSVTKAEELVVQNLYVAIPVWRGVLAGLKDEFYVTDDETAELQEIPFFLTMGEPERHRLVAARGMSMAPRIEHAERALIKLDPDVPPGHLVIARSPDGKKYIKRLVRHTGALALHSVNDEYEPISDLSGWELQGGVTAILHTYEPGRGNIEFDEGRYLRA